jgi:hypothetical protein
MRPIALVGLGVVIALALASTFGASIAHAQPSEVTKAFQDGVDAFRLGKYAEARASLEKARGLDPKLPGPHRFLAAVAQAERRWDDCVASARQAIALKPDSTEVAATRTIHDACRDGLGRAPFTGSFGDGGAISVTANVEGATVTLGGLRYGATPLAPRSLATGTVEVTVEKTGWLPARATVEVLPQIVTDVELALEPDPNAGLDATPPAVDPTTHGWLVLGGDANEPDAEITIDGETVAYVDQIPLGGGVHEVKVEAPGRERWRRRVRITRGQRTKVDVALPTFVDRAGSRRSAMYVLAGAGVLALAGMGAAVVSSRAAEEARDIYREETTRPSAVPIEDTIAIEPLHTRADLEDARSKATTWSYVSLASYGVALVGAGIGAYLLLRDRPTDVDGEPAPFAVAPLVGDGGLGAAVSYRGELDW